MLLRRIYQGLGLALALCGAFLALSSAWRTVAAGAGLSGLILGLGVGVLLGALGFAAWQFATGPEASGKDVLGVERKAEMERERSLARKSPPVKGA